MFSGSQKHYLQERFNRVERMICDAMRALSPEGRRQFLDALEAVIDTARDKGGHRMYRCKECGAQASVDGGVITRTCAHTCGVTMDMGAACAGKSSCGERVAQPKDLAFFERVGAAFIRMVQGAKQAPKDA